MRHEKIDLSGAIQAGAELSIEAIEMNILMSDVFHCGMSVNYSISCLYICCNLVQKWETNTRSLSLFCNKLGHMHKQEMELSTYLLVVVVIIVVVVSVIFGELQNFSP